MITMISYKCPICKKIFQKPKGYNKRTKIPVCSRKCFNIKNRGKNNGNWKGGRVLRNGYIAIRKMEHPFVDAHGYVFEHRLVMEKKLGRYLKPYELVHHLNHNPVDNRIKNLRLTTRPLHPTDHPRERNKLGQFV